jgi:hypothetical protein
MFGLKSLNEFAVRMAEDIVRTVPSEKLHKDRNYFTLSKITKELEKTYSSAQKYKLENKFGFIKTAYLANSFRWALHDKGYPKDFIDIATEGLVVQLTKRN